MAGICTLCNSLKSSKFIIDGKVFEGCHCEKGLYDKDGLLGYHSLNSVAVKLSKEVKDIQDKCDCWDDRLKTKA